MRDEWIAGVPCARPLALKGNPPSLQVSCLIDQTARVWNDEVLREVFFDYDIQAIKRLPLSRIVGMDCLCWRFSKDGCYSV